MAEGRRDEQVIYEGVLFYPFFKYARVVLESIQM